MENVTGREKVAFVEEGTPAESKLRMLTGNQTHVGLLQEPGSGGVEGGGWRWRVRNTAGFTRI